MAVESPKILLIKSFFFLTKAIRLFLASNAFSDIGSVGRIEKKIPKKKSQEVSE